MAAENFSDNASLISNETSIKQISMQSLLYFENIFTLVVNLIAVILHFAVLHEATTVQQFILQKKYILFYMTANFTRVIIYITECVGELLQIIKYKELDISLSLNPTLEASLLDIILIYSDYFLFTSVQIVCLLQACNWLKTLLKRLPLPYIVIMILAAASSLTSLSFIVVDRFPMLLSIFSEGLLKFKLAHQMTCDHIQCMANLFFLLVSCITPRVVFKHIYRATKNSNINNLKETHQKLKFLLTGMSAISFIHLVLVIAYIFEQHLKLGENSHATISLRMLVRIFYRSIPFLSIVVMTKMLLTDFTPKPAPKHKMTGGHHAASPSPLITPRD